MRDKPGAVAHNWATSQGIGLNRWLAGDQIWMCLLGLAVLVSRLPFRSQILDRGDSVSFAYAIQEYNRELEQPQPPGHIVYDRLARIVEEVVQDAQTTLVGIRVVASALAVVALHGLGRSMDGRRVGLIASAVLASSPLFWFYGEIARPHTLDALIVILSARWLYETTRGDQRYLHPAVVVLPVAGGARQQTLVFVAPAALFALRRTSQ